MHDCCIRVFRVDLELTTQQDRGSGVNHAFNSNQLGLNFGTIMTWNLRGMSPHNGSLLVQEKGVWSSCFYIQD